MRPGRLAILCVVVLPILCAGCATGFTGEWVEDGVPGPNGSTVAPTGERQMALKFDYPSTLRYGSYDSHIGAVDANGMQSSSFFLLDGWQKAQFGSMIAQVNGDHMVASVDGEMERHFTRVHGKSIFPPAVTLPELP